MTEQSPMILLAERIEKIVSLNAKFGGAIAMTPDATSALAEMLRLLADPSNGLGALERDARRYRYLRNRPEDTIGKGGIFAGMTPKNVILTEDDLDRAVDAAIMSAREPK